MPHASFHKRESQDCISSERNAISMYLSNWGGGCNFGIILHYLSHNRNVGEYSFKLLSIKKINALILTCNNPKIHTVLELKFVELNQRMLRSFIFRVVF